MGQRQRHWLGVWLFGGLLAGAAAQVHVNVSASCSTEVSCYQVALLNAWNLASTYSCTNNMIYVPGTIDNYVCGYNNDLTVLTGTGPQTQPQGGILITSSNTKAVSITVNVVFSSSDVDLTGYATFENDFYIAATPTATPIYHLDSDSNYLSHCSQSVINTVTYDKCSYSFVIPGYTAYVGMSWLNNDPLEWFNLTYFWTVPANLTCSSSSSQLPNNANNYWTGVSFGLSSATTLTLIPSTSWYYLGEITLFSLSTEGSWIPSNYAGHSAPILLSDGPNTLCGRNPVWPSVVYVQTNMSTVVGNILELNMVYGARCDGCSSPITTVQTAVLTVYWSPNNSTWNLILNDSAVMMGGVTNKNTSTFVVTSTTTYFRIMSNVTGLNVYLNTAQYCSAGELILLGVTVYSCQTTTTTTTAWRSMAAAR